MEFFENTYGIPYIAIFTKKCMLWGQAILLLEITLPNHIHIKVNIFKYKVSNCYQEFSLRKNDQLITENWIGSPIHLDLGELLDWMFQDLLIKRLQCN